MISPTREVMVRLLRSADLLAASQRGNISPAHRISEL